MSYLNILYEDDYLIAVNKPSGLLVHPNWIAPKKTPNLAYSVKRYFNGGTVYTVHRLDRSTSGVILFAKDKETAKAFSQLFTDNKIEKTYLCVVRGYTPEQGVIDYALKPIFDKMIDHPDSDKDKPAKEAVSEYRRLATIELPIPVSRYPCARYSLVEVKPKTGRKHQIRRHMKHLLHPLVGDTKYGEGRHNRLFREHFSSHRLLLMATEIKFEHPVTGQPMHITAPVSPDLSELFDQFGWQGLYPKPLLDSSDLANTDTATISSSKQASIEVLAGELNDEETADYAINQ